MLNITGEFEAGGSSRVTVDDDGTLFLRLASPGPTHFYAVDVKPSVTEVERLVVDLTIAAQAMRRAGR